MTADSVPEPVPLPPVILPQSVRYLIVLGVVAGWMTLGGMFHLNAYVYLMLGVPLLVFFQIGVARRPLSELWIRPATPAPFPWWGYLLIPVFMAWPVIELVRLPDRASWILQLYLGCAIVGAVPLAFTLTRLSRKVLSSLLLCLATGGVLGCAKMVIGAWSAHHLHPLSWDSAGFGALQFLILLPVCFVLEEVFFRGGLDSYLHRPGDPLPWLSAFFISLLWGLWHLPILGIRGILPLLGAALILPPLHCLTGVPYALYWRRSGSLLVPATSHALVDAVRNMLAH
jgi:membrane protease YdiL (CAAX protease family)